MLLSFWFHFLLFLLLLLFHCCHSNFVGKYDLRFSRRRDRKTVQMSVLPPWSGRWVVFIYLVMPYNPEDSHLSNFVAIVLGLSPLLLLTLQVTAKTVQNALNSPPSMLLLLCVNFFPSGPLHWGSPDCFPFDPTLSDFYCAIIWGEEDALLSLRNRICLPVSPQLKKG
jgi:hypothetical protein